MPAFLTHYSCGYISWKSMENNALRQNISAHQSVYSLGLAGPDPFFYSAVESIRKGRNSGSVMHTERSGRFLQALYAETLHFKGEDRACANAYLAGFLGHYSLDCSCHPYVYRKTLAGNKREELGKHYRLEAAMDVLSCRNILKKDIRDVHQLQLIRMTRRERSVVAKMLSGAMEQTWADPRMRPTRFRLELMLVEYYFLTGVLLDPTGFKEWLMLGFETLRYGRTYMSALMINGNLYGVGEKEWTEFKAHFDRGTQNHAHLLSALERTLHDPACESELFEAIGNRSYHDGQELEG